jgi:hypothetical protein
MFHTWDDAVFTQMLEGGLTALADANYPASGSYIDVSEFEHFVFLIGLDTVATPDFQVYQDTSATQTSGIKVITGAAKTDVVTGDDGKWFSIEVESARLDIANGFRYVTLTVSGTGGSDNANVWFFGYRARRMPVTQPDDYLAAVVVAG